MTKRMSFKFKWVALVATLIVGIGSWQLAIARLGYVIVITSPDIYFEYSESLVLRQIINKLLKYLGLSQGYAPNVNLRPRSAIIMT
ncbi:hypothetical protein WP50_17395 [Lactiplantibacillus plantarum]|nr:hypothetical protein WP50_17395 [Lactiplantibacillus plantarum]